jgi:hypothetical protein
VENGFYPALGNTQLLPFLQYARPYRSRWRYAEIVIESSESVPGVFAFHSETTQLTT